MKVFLDTNVLVAAFATRGLCEDLFRTVLAEHDLILSDAVLKELDRVLVGKLKMPSSKVRHITTFLRSKADVVCPKEAVPWPQNDPDDRWILAAGIEANADVLVTGDTDLLELTDDIPVAIVSPREFWEKLRYRSGRVAERNHAGNC